MQRRVLESLVESIAHYSGYADPSSPLYKARNPIGLRPLKPEQPFDEFGNRIFRSVLDGFQAALFDVEVKIGGRLSPASTLTDLALSYGRKATEAQAWARFLRQALDDEAINAKTQISKFLEEINGN